MWRPVGLVTVTASTVEVPIGFVAAPLQGGFLPLRISSSTPGGLVPLSFAVLRAIPAADDVGLADGRYYPNPGESTVMMGPGLGSQFEGTLKIKPRGWNTRWLAVGHPASTWQIQAEAWAPTGQTLPRFVPGGFVRGLLGLIAGPQPTGPAGAAPLIYG